LIGAVKQPFPICLELWIPTLAYHQGFRIRSLRDQEKYVSWHGNKTDDIKSAQEDGSWFVHPIKNIKTVKN